MLLVDILVPVDVVSAVLLFVVGLFPALILLCFFLLFVAFEADVEAANWDIENQTEDSTKSTWLPLS